MDIKRIHAGVSHLPLHAASPHVAGILRFLPVRFHPVLPGIAEVAAKHELVELIRFILAEKRILERLGAISLLENQTERVFRILLGQTSVTAVQTQAAGSRKVVILFAAHQFDAGRTGPPVTGSIANRRTRKDIDTAGFLVVLMTEQIVAVGYDTQHGYRLQPLTDLRRQRGILGHFGVHAVIRLGNTAHLDITAPLAGIAFGGIALIQHIVNKQIGSRRNIGHLILARKGSRPHDGVIADVKGLGIRRAGRRRRTAVERVSDCPVHRILIILHRKRQLERGIAKAMRLAKRNALGHNTNRCHPGKYHTQQMFHLLFHCILFYVRQYYTTGNMLTFTPPSLSKAGTKGCFRARKYVFFLIYPKNMSIKVV